MKILFLTPWYPDERQPASGVFIRAQADAISGTHDVAVISSKIDYSKFAICSYSVTESVYGRVEERRLSIKRTLPIYNQLNYFIVTSLYAIRFARKFKPDIVHASVGYPGAFLGFIVSRVLRQPFVVTEHTRVTNNFRSYFHKYLTLYGFRKASRVLSVSETLAHEMEVLLDRAVDVVPNAVEVERFSTIRGSSDKIPQIGFLGGMNTPVKGLDVLLKALSGVDRNFMLHIGGKGILESQYKAMTAQLGIKHKCCFYSFLPYAEIPAFMSRLHFFVCSSRYETFCVSLVEAMASGLPIISTRCGGPQDFVCADNGILVDKENPEKLKEAIEEMMQRYNKYNADAIRSTAMQFSKKKFLERIETIYKAAKI